MFTGGVVAGCEGGRRRWWEVCRDGWAVVGRRWRMAGEAMLARLGCGGEGSGGLVELCGGVVGGGDLVVGVVFGPK